MTTIKSQISQAVFDRLEALMDEAASFGLEGQAEYLRASAYALGAQVAVTGKPNDMPDMINDFLSEFGRGIQAGMLTAHGMSGRLGVKVYSVTKS